MEATARPAPALANVGEAWCIYDTVRICKDIPEDSNQGFQSYAAFAAKSKIPFFNVRNEGEVGIAYCNLETKDNIPYVFHVYSLGVEFKAPQGIVEQVPGQVPPQHNAAIHALFNTDIPYHVGVRFKVQQDQRLLHTAMLAPSGSGVFGLAGGFDPGGANTGSIVGATQGHPELSNRWKFPVPIIIPRGATMSVELELSEYGKKLMGAFSGPGPYSFSNGQVGVSVPACAIVRVSLMGKREVQQRGQYHR